MDDWAVIWWTAKSAKGRFDFGAGSRGHFHAVDSRADDCFGLVLDVLYRRDHQINEDQVKSSGCLHYL